MSEFALATGMTAGPLVLAEAAYRARVARNVHAMERAATAALNYEAASGAILRHDAAHGFAYVPGARAVRVQVTGGRVSSWRHDRVSARGTRGTPGTTIGDGSVLVFGSTWTSDDDAGGVTWPDVLRERLHGDVDVVNLGRDGYGALQMLDLAAASVTAVRPRHAVFAIATTDLDRDRIWRAVVAGPTGLQIVKWSGGPVQSDATPVWGRGVLHPDITVAWCEQMKARHDPGDALLRALNRWGPEARAQTAMQVPWRTLRSSFLLDRARFGKPFVPTGYLRLSRFVADARFADAAALVRARVPITIIHLATPSISARERELLESLRVATGASVVDVAWSPALRAGERFSEVAEAAARAMKGTV